MTSILLYAHDGVGYGHIARMANVASCIQLHSTDAAIHFVSGYHNIYNFFPKDIPLIHHKIPCLRKQEIIEQDELEQLLNERADKLRTIFLAQPYDFIIIDFFPFGSKDELTGLLLAARKLYPNTRIILTQRGIVFSKEKTLQFFKGSDGLQYVNTVYDAILCFCDPRIIDLNEEYFHGGIQLPVSYCGYIYQPGRYILRNHSEAGMHILIDFGGGYGCDELLIRVLSELECKISHKDRITILLGEYFKQATRDYITLYYRSAPSISILGNSPDKSTRAIEIDIVISCGGYNVMADSILNAIPAIVIPKNIDAEAGIHSERIAVYSSLEIISQDQIHELWPLVNKMVKAPASHDLLVCDPGALFQLLNNRYENIDHNIAC